MSHQSGPPRQGGGNRREGKVSPRLTHQRSYSGYVGFPQNSVDLMSETLQNVLLIVNTGGTFSQILERKELGVPTTDQGHVRRDHLARLTRRICDVIEELRRDLREKNERRSFANFGAEYMVDFVPVVVNTEPFLDSSNLKVCNWDLIANCIMSWHRSTHVKLIGAVVISGTDTLNYTSAALAFMLRHLNFTLVVTGAQYPLLGLSRGDAADNLSGAILLCLSRWKSAFQLERDRILNKARCAIVKEKNDAIMVLDEEKEEREETPEASEDQQYANSERRPQVAEVKRRCEEKLCTEFHRKSERLAQTLDNAVFNGMRARGENSGGSDDEAGIFEQQMMELRSLPSQSQDEQGDVEVSQETVEVPKDYPGVNQSIPLCGVYVVFNHRILHGASAVKTHSHSVDGFTCPKGEQFGSINNLSVDITADTYDPKRPTRAHIWHDWYLRHYFRQWIWSRNQRRYLQDEGYDISRYWGCTRLQPASTLLHPDLGNLRTQRARPIDLVYREYTGQRARFNHIPQIRNPCGPFSGEQFATKSFREQEVRVLTVCAREDDRKYARVTMRQCFPEMTSKELFTGDILPSGSGDGVWPHAIVLSAFGAGNGPDGLLEPNDQLGRGLTMQDAYNAGVLVVVVTECVEGKVDSHYATSLQGRYPENVVALFNCTASAAFAKLHIALGSGPLFRTKPGENERWGRQRTIRKRLQVLRNLLVKPIANEFTYDSYSIRVSELNTLDVLTPPE